MSTPREDLARRIELAVVAVAAGVDVPWALAVADLVMEREAHPVSKKLYRDLWIDAIATLTNIEAQRDALQRRLDEAVEGWAVREPYLSLTTLAEVADAWAAGGYTVEPVLIVRGRR